MHAYKESLLIDERTKQASYAVLQVYNVTMWVYIAMM